MKNIFKLLLTVLTFISFKVSAQSAKSPQEYFGIEMGDRFYFHHQLIEYHKYLNTQFPANTKLISMGKTTEGREQMILAIGTKEHISKFEEIRTSNLKNIGLMEGSATIKVPAIAMLSYNVHGNESVSANAAIFVAHDLLKNIDKGLLNNTLVLIDPCVNPDGYDRYTTWYNRYKSQTPDLNTASIEHNEPWPGGRFNHYLFDLNRDLAWQTQQESQNRMQFYNSWMPHLHADFHEMGPNSTYYFAPSAKPFHEDLSKYQRDFQTKLGEFNKKRFDEKGWLYYTKENYDLLYPSYGDTYPSYNGAIGMTFEQAGSGNAGLAFMRTDGDTLTLKDRILRAIATSIGTLEAIGDNHVKTVSEFNSFFNNPAKKGYGKYNSFVMKYAGNEQNIKALTKQLDLLQIQYSFADKKQNITAYNYQTRKEENAALDINDLIVSTSQPKGVFAKILFEPNTMLEDSNTYDITAWSLAYAYNTQAWATSQKITGTRNKNVNSNKSDISNAYAYAIPWNSIEDAKFLANVLKEKIKVRTQEKPFSVNNKNFKAGTLLITRNGNEALGKQFDSKINEIAQKYGIDLVALNSGLVNSGPDIGSESTDFMANPKVGLIMGQGTSPTSVGEIWHFFEKQIAYPITLIDGAYINKVNMSNFDVIICADGSYTNIFKEIKEVSKWINDGGRMVLIEGANQLVDGKEGFELKSKAKPEAKAEDKTYAAKDRKAISDYNPGAIFKVELDNTHPLAYGYPSYMYTIVKNVFNYEPLKDAWTVGKLTPNSLTTGFVGSKAKVQLANTPIFAVQDMGKGKVIHLAESPIFRAFWHNGKLMMANAVFMVR